MAHKFGGIWTQKKLEVLDSYLKFYVNALKNQRFTLHYADAFAGTGSHTPKDDMGEEVLIPHEDFRGSVSTALEVDPGFDVFHFNDLDPEHVLELEAFKQKYPNKDIRIGSKDANVFVPEFCASLGAMDRAVLLLDPYSTQLNWDTLKYVAGSEKVDLWLLFPISVILRMTPRDGAKIRDDWKDTLNRLLGTDDWQNSLYKPIEKPPIDDLFGENPNEPAFERVNTPELEAWVGNRLSEIFQWVAKPVRLKNNGRPLFLFYFAVSNSSPKALGLAQRVASQIVKKFGND